MPSVLLLALACVAQTDADALVRRHLSARAAELEKEFLPEVKSADAFEKLRPQLREQYFTMLGLSPMPPKTPLNAAVTGRLDGDGFTVENLHFQSRPGLYVTANLYLPKPASGRHPAILYSCGHSGMGRNGNKTAFQDHGIWFATHGYVCLVFDTLQLGEIAGIHHGTYNQGRWWWHSAGYTPAGVECWNGIRALDYLASRPEVDPDRIGATGISGGGASTFWISAADERVRVAVPVSGMADLGYYVGQDGVNGHCDCMFLYNWSRWNWTTIAALVCPRPMLFTNSDKDGIFPMSANERISNRLEHLYAYFGESDRFDTMVSIGGHAYRTDLRRAIFEFFNRYLKGDARRVEDPDSGLGPDGKPSRIKPEALRVFPEDKDLPADRINAKVDESFVARAQVELPAPGRFEAWRDGLIERFRAASLAAWPPPDGVGVIVKEGDDVLRVLNADEEAVGPATCLRPRGGWTRKNPPNTIERSTALLGTTVDAARVWDILTELRREPYRRVEGRGPAGILAAYAALFEPGVASIVLIDPPASHGPSAPDTPYGPAIPNVLRVADIPELLGCLAPRPLTLVNAKDPAFDRTVEIYRRAGAADQIHRK
jgi:dienelactone hydrolase